MKYFYFLVFLLVWQDAWPAPDDICAPGNTHDRGQVRHVYDGDTVLLEDGRRLRLIGINAPEIGRDGKPSQPGAEHARGALVRILGRNRQVSLRFGKERNDRYGRILAHLYLENGRNINALLVEQGFAAAIAVPPNLDLLPCYARAEAMARKKGRGIWSTDYFKPVPARRLNKGVKGFRLLKGTVRKISPSRRSIWLELEGKAALRIARKDLSYFESDEIARYTGRTILARGWIYHGREGPVMQIRHPFSLQLAE